MPMWISWALFFIASSSCAGKFGVVSQLATKPVFFPTQSQLCLQALFLIFHPSLSQNFCTLICPQAIFGSLSSNHASCSTERRGETAALVLLAFRVLWLFCPQSAGVFLSPRGTKIPSFPSYSKACSFWAAPYALVERDKSWRILWSVWSRPSLTWERVAGESWKLSHYSVACIIPEIWEAVLKLLQEHRTTFPWPVDCVLWGACVTHRNQEAEWVSMEWDPSMDVGGLHWFPAW